MITGKSVSFHAVTLFVLVSFTSLSLVMPAAEAKTDFTHNPEQTTNQTNTSDIDPEKDMKVIESALSRDDVKKKLETIGYTPEEIEKRINRLSDEEIHEMAENIRSIKAGGHLGLDELEVVTLIVLALLAPILVPVFIIMLLLGHDIHLHHENGEAHEAHAH